MQNQWVEIQYKFWCYPTCLYGFLVIDMPQLPFLKSQNFWILVSEYIV